MATQHLEHHDFISITPLLKRLVDPSTLSLVLPSEIASAISLIFTNRLSTSQASSLLTLLASTERGWEPAVIAQCASTMRDAAAQVDSKAIRAAVKKRGRKEGTYNGGLCDLVGTGGDGHSTFNVSTTASIIAASLLVVAKHGSRASSSKSGSADMLQAIRPRPPVLEAITKDTIEKVYERGSYAFLFAPQFHAGMRFVAPIRKELGFRTIFNIMGPLVNPLDALIEARVYGVAKRSLGPVFAEALRMSGAKKAMVVCGAEDLDEISCAGETFCWRLVERPNPEFRGPRTEEDENYTTSDEEAPPRNIVKVEEFTVRPEDFGLPAHELTEVLPGKEPAENAEILMRLLKNELSREDPTLHFVLINAAALFVVAGVCDAETSSMGDGDSGEVVTEVGPGGGRWKEGLRRARWAVESGEALKALNGYIEFTNDV